jgi:hypothetical protein
MSQITCHQTICTLHRVADNTIKRSVLYTVSQITYHQTISFRKVAQVIDRYLGFYLSRGTIRSTFMLYVTAHKWGFHPSVNILLCCVKRVYKYTDEPPVIGFYIFAMVNRLYQYVLKILYYKSNMYFSVFVTMLFVCVSVCSYTFQVFIFI